MTFFASYLQTGSRLRSPALGKSLPPGLTAEGATGGFVGGGRRGRKVKWLPARGRENPGLCGEHQGLWGLMLSWSLIDGVVLKAKTAVELLKQDGGREKTGFL